MRLYITGGTGLVGSNVIRLARQRNDIEIIAAQFGPAPEWDVDYQLDPLDMADTDALRASIRKYRPDAVIHCAAFLDHPQMVQRRSEVWQMTVDANLAFAQTCAEVGARYVFVSSDWVFDGQKPLVDEDSPPFPVNYYGFMKAVCERDIMGVSGLSYGVGRMAGIFGLNYSNPSLLRKFNDIGFNIGNYILHQLSAGLDRGNLDRSQCQLHRAPDHGLRWRGNAAAPRRIRRKRGLPLLGRRGRQPPAICPSFRRCLWLRSRADRFRPYRSLYLGPTPHGAHSLPHRRQQ